MDIIRFYTDVADVTLFTSSTQDIDISALLHLYAVVYVEYTCYIILLILPMT